MTLADLFKREAIPAEQVLVLRHRPHEPGLRKVLPRLAAVRPDLFNAYQQTQTPGLEQTMLKLVGKGFVASFIGHEPGRAMFVAMYKIDACRPMTYGQFWRRKEYVELKTFGMRGLTAGERRRVVQWFDLRRTSFYESWIGRLVVSWSPPERSWWRRAHKNEFGILSILEDNALAEAMPDWSDLVLSWNELKVLPKAWQTALSHWRGIYYIFDRADGKGYVGSAYGRTNLLGRWLNYADKGHGGNALLRNRDPGSFEFSILQRVSPDLEQDEIVRLENSWKERLHTRAPTGLNDN